MEEKHLQSSKKGTTKSKVLFGLKIAGNVVFYAVILGLLIFSIMNIRSGKDSFPNIFGKGFLAVVSDSMERQPESSTFKNPEEWKNYKIQGINKGDLIHADVFNGNINSLKVGDVITYYDSSLKGLNSHRIVYISVEGQYVITQGDKAAQFTPYDKTNPTSNENAILEMQGRIEHVALAQIRGVATGVQGGAGNVLLNIQQNWLFYFVIPVGIILLVEIFFVFKNILDLKNEKNKQNIQEDKEAMKAELELEREKMRAEILAELEKQKAEENNSEEKEEPQSEE